MADIQGKYFRIFGPLGIFEGAPEITTRTRLKTNRPVAKACGLSLVKWILEYVEETDHTNFVAVSAELTFSIKFQYEFVTQTACATYLLGIFGPCSFLNRWRLERKMNLPLLDFRAAPRVKKR